MNIFLLTVTCKKPRMETQIERVKYAQRQQWRHRNDIFGVTLFLHSNVYTKNVKKKDVTVTGHYIL